jgi:hypothetical protein
MDIYKYADYYNSRSGRYSANAADDGLLYRTLRRDDDEIL